MNRHIRRRGLSLAEVLITVAICGALMTAVCVAFQATSQAMQANERFFRASQTARVCLTQIMAETRRCRSGSIDDTSFEMVTAAGETRDYEYDAAHQQLTMTPHVGIAPWPTYILARNVSACTFSTSGDSVSLSLTVTVEGNRISLTGSSVPRKTVQYR